MNGIRFFFAVTVFAISCQHGAAKDTFRILSLDGGGVRGLIEAVVLEEMEKELDKPISSIFNMVAGSSTGGLIALGLTVPNHQGNARYKAQEIADIYLTKGYDVFYRSMSHRILTLGGLVGPKYQSHRFKDLLNQYFGNTTLKQAIVPVLITGYHVEGQTGVEFFSPDATQFPDSKDCLMRSVALATSAAPAFFNTVDIAFSWGLLNSVVDGGLYKNNPALLAYVNAKTQHPDKNIEVYSIGAGNISAEELNAHLKGRGILQWISPIILHVQIGDSQADISILHKLLNQDGHQDFFRLDISLNRYHRKMDDVRPRNIDYLYERAQVLVQSPQFTKVIERLKQS